MYKYKHICIHWFEKNQKKHSKYGYWSYRHFFFAVYKTNECHRIEYYTIFLSMRCCKIPVNQEFVACICSTDLACCCTNSDIFLFRLKKVSSRFGVYRLLVFSEFQLVTTFSFFLGITSQSNMFRNIYFHGRK